MEFELVGAPSRGNFAEFDSYEAQTAESSSICKVEVRVACVGVDQRIASATADAPGVLEVSEHEHD